MNRSAFLIRLLKYFNDTGCRYPVVVGDSSNTEEFEKTRTAIEKDLSGLDVVQIACPGMTNGACLRKISGNVRTKYVAFIADDDYLIHSNFAECVDFLEKNPDYSCAHGLGVILWLKKDGVYGEIKAAISYKMPVIEDGTAVERYLHLNRSFNTGIFSVHRTDVWEKMWEESEKVVDRSLGEEVLACSIAAIRGKVKQIDKLYLVRQDHESRYLLSGPYEWITSKIWHSSWGNYIDIISRSIAQTDGLDIEKAVQTANLGFKVYLQQIMGASNVRSTLPNEYLDVFTRRICNLFHRIMPLRSISLRSLMDKRSPYHKDFLPVLRSLTGSAETRKESE